MKIEEYREIRNHLDAIYDIIYDSVNIEHFYYGDKTIRAVYDPLDFEIYKEVLMLQQNVDKACAKVIDEQYNEDYGRLRKSLGETDGE